MDLNPMPTNVGHQTGDIFYVLYIPVLLIDRKYRPCLSAVFKLQLRADIVKNSYIDVALFVFSDRMGAESIGLC